MGEANDFNGPRAVRGYVQLRHQLLHPSDGIALTFDHQRIGSLAGNDTHAIRPFRAFANLLGCKLLKQRNDVFNPSFFEVNNGDLQAVGNVDTVNDFH